MPGADQHTLHGTRLGHIQPAAQCKCRRARFAITAEIYALFQDDMERSDTSVGRLATGTSALKSTCAQQRADTSVLFSHGLHHEWGGGFPVKSVRLQWCGSANRKEIDVIETEWINKFPDLLNERKVYRRTQKKPPVIPGIREYMRRLIFNVDGLHGIHWWRDYDKFAVFLLASGFRWATSWLAVAGASISPVLPTA